jgi:hypothetical protein
MQLTLESIFPVFANILPGTLVGGFPVSFSIFLPGAVAGGDVLHITAYL